MNDVIDAQRYTQAAYWDRIPPGAWSLMAAIAIFANVMIGYGSRRETQEKGIFFILPIVLATISFMLIADIDSPRGGLIHVRPLNLESLAQWLPRFHSTTLEEDVRHFVFNGDQANVLTKCESSECARTLVAPFTPRSARALYPTTA